jgi:hypothetical protein
VLVLVVHRHDRHLHPCLLGVQENRERWRVRDVGIDQVRVQPDGTVILSIVGQVLFGFTGVMKINPETGEVILEPHHFFDIEDVCAQLAA